MIAVIDSGIGGLNIVAAICHVLPTVDVIGFSDQKHFPYGTQKKPFLLARCCHIIDYLSQHYPLKVIVLACNTITTELITELRERYRLPIVGVEPAIKPATQQSPTGRIGVMATPNTLSSNRYQQLKKQHGLAHTILDIPCPALAQLIEQQNYVAIAKYLPNIQQTLHVHQIDTVVLGCTHYAFVKHNLQVFEKNYLIIDSADAVAKQVKNIYLNNHQAPSTAATVCLITNNCLTYFTQIIDRLVFKYPLHAAHVLKNTI